jgi:hypothetical protein
MYMPTEEMLSMVSSVQQQQFIEQESSSQLMSQPNTVK